MIQNQTVLSINMGDRWREDERDGQRKYRKQMALMQITTTIECGEEAALVTVHCDRRKEIKWIPTALVIAHAIQNKCKYMYSILRINWKLLACNTNDGAYDRCEYACHVMYSVCQTRHRSIVACLGIRSQMLWHTTNNMFSICKLMLLSNVWWRSCCEYFSEYGTRTCLRLSNNC